MIILTTITKQGSPQTSLPNILKIVLIFFITVVDMPVTFHKKIKSSGYGSKPNSLKFSAK